MPRVSINILKMNDFPRWRGGPSHTAGFRRDLRGRCGCRFMCRYAHLTAQFFSFDQDQIAGIQRGLG
jgi:hypothetical protein